MKSDKYFLILLYGLLLLLIANPQAASAADTPQGNGTWNYGKISAQVRMYYFLQEDSPAGDSFSKSKESFAIGGQLKYETPWLADHFGGTVNGFLAAPLFDDLNRERYSGSGVLNNKNQGYAVIGEAFFRARYAGTVAKLYRQRIETPYVNGNDSRLLPSTFEAYGLESSDISGLMLHAAWLDKIKKRDSDEFISMTKAAGADTDGGTVMLGADWKGEKTALRLWNYYTPDMDNTLYAEAKYSFDISDSLEGHVRFQGVNQRSMGENILGVYDALEGGLLLGIKFMGLTADIGGSITDDTDNIRTPWGVNPFFTHMMIGDYNRAGEKALYLALAYDFAKLGLKGFSAGVKTAFGETPNSGPNASYDRRECDLSFNYNFDGALDGFSIKNQVGYQDADRSMGGKDVVQVRLRLQYDF